QARPRGPPSGRIPTSSGPVRSAWPSGIGRPPPCPVKRNPLRPAPSGSHEVVGRATILLDRASGWTSNARRGGVCPSAAPRRQASITNRRRYVVFNPPTRGDVHERLRSASHGKPEGRALACRHVGPPVRRRAPARG